MKRLSMKKVKIINPCHKKINDFKSIDGKKYCDGCQKKIYDFSNSTLIEIRDVYNQKKGAVCGIFNQGVLASKQEHTIYKGLKLFALSSLLVFGSSLFVFGQQTQQEIDAFHKQAEKIIGIPTATIKGKVKNSFEEQTLNVYYNDSLIGTAIVKDDRTFELEIPITFTDESLIFEIDIPSFHNKKGHSFRYEDIDITVNPYKKLVLIFKAKRIYYKTAGVPSF